MLGDYEVLEIKLMHKQGKSIKSIARETGYSINTVRKYARDFAASGYSKRPNKPKKLDGFIDYIEHRINTAHPIWLPATVICREIKEMGYKGEISLLRAFLRTLKPAVIERPLVRFETEPGEQMQVDFANFRLDKFGFYAFVAVLGFSRMLYVEFVEEQKVDTLMRCHENAFDYFAGVTKYCLYDNMKTVIIQRNAYGPGNHRLHSGFYDFAKHFGFIPRVCKPYNPQTKGKVERMISYLRHSFYNPFIVGRDIISISELNIAVIDWLNTIANQRVHATTKAVPFTQWHIEKTALMQMPYSFTNNYGEKEIKDITKHYSAEVYNFSIQHDLDVYESLLRAGGAV